MNQITDDFFTQQKHRSVELMNYQNRGQFSSSSLGDNTHLLRPLRPVTENALKDTVISKRPQQRVQYNMDPGISRRPQMGTARSPMVYPGIGMSMNQQFTGLGMQNQQIQTLQRQPIAQLSNIALGGQLTSGMPSLPASMPAFNMPRQPDMRGTSISVMKQPNSDTMPVMPSPAIPGFGVARFASPSMMPGLGGLGGMMSGQQQIGGRGGNIMSSFLPQQGISQQQELAQQQVCTRFFLIRNLGFSP